MTVINFLRRQFVAPEEQKTLEDIKPVGFLQLVRVKYCIGILSIDNVTNFCFIFRMY